MSGLKHLRNRVKSIKSTQKITKAMQVVSAAKLKKVKEQAENLNDFCEVLGEVLFDISTSGNLMSLSESDRRFFEIDVEAKPALILVITSERGLCGSFNSSIIKKVKHDIRRLEKDGKDFRLIVIGKKGLDALKNEFGSKILAHYFLDKNKYECLAREVRDKLFELVESRSVGACLMYYNEFKNAMSQIPTKEQILPAKSHKETKNYASSDYEGADLVRNVISMYIGGQINYGILQSRASEEGARMTAMDNATRNAKELVDKLTIKLNRSRQAMITTELIEIISGAEAL